MKYYFTYVLQSRVDRSYYVGWTDDLELRLKKHNAGKVKSTANKKPFEIVYYEACFDKSAAIKRERSLKTGFGRAYLKRRI